MKKLLIGLLALVSISAFAQQVKNHETVTNLSVRSKQKCEVFKQTMIKISSKEIRLIPTCVSELDGSAYENDAIWWSLNLTVSTRIKKSEYSLKPISASQFLVANTSQDSCRLLERAFSEYTFEGGGFFETECKKASDSSISIEYVFRAKFVP